MCSSDLALTDAVLKAAGSGDLACDFFAGMGFFTLGLARRFARVIAVESSRFAVDDLDVNLRTAGLANVTIMGERLETLLLDEQLAGERPQVVLLDPPRTGLPPGSADGFLPWGFGRAPGARSIVQKVSMRSVSSRPTTTTR